MFGPAQVEWIKTELQLAASVKQNVVFLLSFSWKSQREWGPTRKHEQEEISELIMSLGFNSKDKPWLVMISGDSHMLTFDDGSKNLYGGFPIF